MINWDSYLEPPDNDVPEPPECPKCKSPDTMWREDAAYGALCLDCKHLWELPMPKDPEPEPIEEYDPEDFPQPELPKKCPHGNNWGECGACDFLSDQAFDAAREDRFR